MFPMWRTSPPTTHHLPVGHPTFIKFSPCFLLPPSLGAHHLSLGGSSVPGCSRQEYQSGLLCPPSGDLPDLGVCKPESPASNALKVDSVPPEPPGKPIYFSTQRLFSEYTTTWYTFRGSAIKIKLKLLGMTVGPCAHVLPFVSGHTACGTATGTESLAAWVLCFPSTWNTLPPFLS